jgi:hypothetical protein
MCPYQEWWGNTGGGSFESRLPEVPRTSSGGACGLQPEERGSLRQWCAIGAQRYRFGIGDREERGANTDATFAEETVNVSLYKTGIKVAAEASREPPSVNEEGPEGVDDGGSSFGLQTIDPGVASCQVHKGEGIFVPPRTGSFAIANVHAYGVEGFRRTFEEFAVVVARDGGHVANGKRRVAFINDMQASPKRFKGLPVLQ